LHFVSHWLVLDLPISNLYKILLQVIFPLDFEKTEQSERFIKTVEAIIKERPDCPNAPLHIPSPGDRGGIGGALAGAAYTSHVHVVSSAVTACVICALSNSQVWLTVLAEQRAGRTAAPE
jgi:hypothetical protein